MIYDKPLPSINNDNRPFWDGCHHHELKFQQCSDCGHVRWPPSFLCPECHSTKTDLLISKGLGKIYSFVVYHTPYLPAFAADVPYVVAVIELNEGPHLLTNIIDCQPEDVTCDMPVQVVWEKATEDITLPKFKPLRE